MTPFKMAFKITLPAVLLALVWWPVAQAQSGIGLTAAPAPVAPAKWKTVHRTSVWAVQVDADSLVTRQGMVIYRVRDTSPSTAADGPGWAAARCETRERADVHNPRVMRGAFDPQRVDASLQSWARPAPGSAAADELEFVCGRSDSVAGNAVVAAPNWTGDERRALIAAWQHTVGSQAMEYRVAHFDSEDLARRGRVMKWSEQGRIGAREARSVKASGLVDVPPALRRPLVNLFEPGERSPLLQGADSAGRPQWSFVELVARSNARDPHDAQDFERQAVRWTAQGLLPQPAALLADPQHAAQAAYWAVRKAADLATVPATLSPSVRFGNLDTPLLRALLVGDADLARGLLARGADPNACGPVGCPLHLAHFEKDDRLRAQWLDMLLAAGAKPDQIDVEYFGARSTVLQSAAFRGDRSTIERLLKAGASPNGAPGVQTTPLQGALAAGRREVAEWLIQRGATVLPLTDRSRGEIFHTNAWMAASEHPELQQWMARAMLDAARRDPRWQFEAHIEQDGKRLALADGATLTLRAAPFKLVLRMEDEQSIALATSFAPAFVAEIRDGERGNGMIRTLMSSAIAPVPEPGSHKLLAYGSKPAAAKPGVPWGGHMNLLADASLRADFHEVRPERKEYVREVRVIAPVSEQPDVSLPAIPMASLLGRELALVLGTSIVLDPYEWAPLVNWRAVTLRLR